LTDPAKDLLKPPPKKATTTAAAADPARVIATVLPTTAVPVSSDPSKFKERNPLVCWTTLGQAIHATGIGGLLYAFKNSPVQFPTVVQSHVCFPFSGGGTQ
jgi:hypothetical protein